MKRAKNTKADIEARASRLAFPRRNDWKNVVRDLKLTKAQERELKVTIQHVLADVKKYQAINRKGPPRDILVAALKRLEKTVGGVQYEMGDVLELLDNWRGASFADLILIQQTGGEPGKGAPHGDENTCFAAHA